MLWNACSLGILRWWKQIIFFAHQKRQRGNAGIGPFLYRLLGGRKDSLPYRPASGPGAELCVCGPLHRLHPVRGFGLLQYLCPRSQGFPHPSSLPVVVCERGRGQGNFEKNDKARSSYYNFYTDKELGRASSYHLCVDTSLLGVEKPAEMVAEIVQWVKVG